MRKIIYQNKYTFYFKLTEFDNETNFTLNVYEVNTNIFTLMFKSKNLIYKKRFNTSDFMNSDGTPRDIPKVIYKEIEEYLDDYSISNGLEPLYVKCGGYYDYMKHDINVK